MKTCPDCGEEVDDEDWAPGIQGSGAQSGVCISGGCAAYYQNREDDQTDYSSDFEIEPR